MGALMTTPPQVKTVGSNGQISIGKEFAGQMVLIEQVSEDTVIIRKGQFIPDSEKWLYEEGVLQQLNRALAWNEKHPPKDNLDQFIKDMKGGRHKN